jgi:hypothetical protein
VSEKKSEECGRARGVMGVPELIIGVSLVAAVVTSYFLPKQ